MASQTFVAEDSSGTQRTIHLASEADQSNLVDALQETFPEHELVNARVEGRGGVYRVHLSGGDTIEVRPEEEE